MIIMNEANKRTLAMGMRIQQARKSAGFTQMQFSEKIGVSTQYISDLERGVVGCSIPTLIKICDILSVSADYILRGFDPSFNSPDLFKKFASFSPQKQKLVEEGFQLLDRAFALK